MTPHPHTTPTPGWVPSPQLSSASSWLPQTASSSVVGNGVRTARGRLPTPTPQGLWWCCLGVGPWNRSVGVLGYLRTKKMQTGCPVPVPGAQTLSPPPVRVLLIHARFIP